MMTRTSKPDGWGAPKAAPEHLPPEALEAWRAATAELRAVAERDGLSKSEAARRADVPLPTLSPWYDGAYKGDVAATTERVVRWLRAQEQQRRAALALPEAPGFIPTPTAQEVLDVLLHAQVLPEMVLVTLGAGMGKTSAARHFVATRPHAHLVTMRPRTAGVHSMLLEVALALAVVERNPARLDRAIGDKLRRNGRQTVLIVDEAQHLRDDAVNQLRWYLDEYDCGLALLGNEEVFGRWGRTEVQEGFGQLHRRVGRRLRRLTPLAEDIAALLDAWGIEDAEVRRLLATIGRKPGALGQVDKTIRGASLLAAAAGEPLAVAHVRRSWIERGGEELR